MRKLNMILCASTATLIALTCTSGQTVRTTGKARLPWNGFFVGASLGPKLITAKGSITTRVNDRDETDSKDNMFFPLPSHTLSLGFNSEFAQSSTISFGFDFDYGVLPTLRVAYGYLISPKHRISLGAGLNLPLFISAFSGSEDLKVHSLYGLTPSISYEQALGDGAFFQAIVSYNYLNLKGENLERDYKFPTPVRRLIRDYWDKEVKSVTGIDATAHGVTISAGFGYAF